MICDSHGNPLDFVLTQGQVHDCTQSSILLAGRTAVAVIADQGYDDNKARTNILDMGAEDSTTFMPGNPDRMRLPPIQGQARRGKPVRPVEALPQPGNPLR